MNPSAVLKDTPFPLLQSTQPARQQQRKRGRGRESSACVERGRAIFPLVLGGGGIAGSLVVVSSADGFAWLEIKKVGGAVTS